jgi:beta-phosphoglucomutase
MVAAEGRIEPRAGARDVLDRLAGRRVPLAVGTVTERATALGILGRAGLLDLFGAGRVVAGENVPRLKPAPDVYQETARRLGVPPDEQLVFEDSVTGIAAARSAGSPVVAMPTVRHPGYLASVATAGASAVFPAWHDRDLLSWLDRATGGWACDA